MRYGVTYHPQAAAHRDARARSSLNGKPYVFQFRMDALANAATYPEVCQARVVRLVPKKRGYQQIVGELTALIREMKAIPNPYGPGSNMRGTFLSLVAMFWDNA